MNTPGPPILCLNSGSSSLKFALYRAEDARPRLLVGGAVERIGLRDAFLWMRDADGAPLLERQDDYPDHASAVQAVFDAAVRLSLPPPAAVGHRVVHGGPRHAAPERVETGLLADLRALVAFAPLHLPGALACIEAVAARFPHLPQAACFDTAFHRRLPELAQRFALPGALWEEGVRRYGFHGLSYEYVLDNLGDGARAASSSPISATVPAWRRCAMGHRWTPPWASLPPAAS